MNSFTLKPSIDGLERTEYVEIERDFCFIIGGKKHYTTKFHACFISQKVTNLLLLDQTMTNFTINIKDDGNLFSKIEQLMIGKPVSIDESSKYSFMSLLHCLGNDELLNQLYGSDFVQNTEIINKQNVLDKIIIKDTVLHIPITKEIEYVAYHLDEFSIEFFQQIGPEIFEQMLNCEKLRVYDEDCLFKMIKKLGKSFKHLLSYVEIENLSEFAINDFIEYIDYTQINIAQWRSITNRLRLPIDKCKIKNSQVLNNNEIEKHKFYINQSNRIYRCNSITVNYNQDDQSYEGIFHYISEKYCSRSAYEAGIVDVTSSSSRLNNCYDIIDYSFNSFFHTEDEPNSWIMFNFKERTFNLTAYMIKSDRSIGFHLKNWVIEGSNDEDGKEEWTLIDSRDTMDLNGMEQVACYTCEKSHKEGFHKIRLRQNGQNTSKGYQLLISSIEFFGSLRE
ncbi:hypothetical protein TRFO_14884 [Tritrichomonas foetus]|uniref:BACK domain-containing protein n=1 Tax=Tritrichomonas foetus TaxID=1144522 RepID=A0A1J4KYB6_9EUKA|nr:hypothetical protein TRFO_14884 [Tritrichomonas foetus]|eukprot:OHT14700.1 hypothetical protein TRFO_14884 [Tritrichomonas foetus]